VNAKVILNAGALERFATDLFVAGGVSADHAAVTAKVLVWADLRGHASHGVMRVPRYLDWVDDGTINRAANPVVTRRKGAIATIDAERAIGPAALSMATDIAIEQVRESGIAWVHVKDHSHSGPIGYYVRQLTEAGMIGMAMTGSRPLMAYYGTKNAALGTSPISIGLPGGLLLDMSPAAIAKGKISAFAAAGKQLPAGVACDADGNPTTDPDKAATILPLGGPKGAGLSLMIEALTGMALANPLITTALTDPKEAVDFRQNALLIAVDPEAIVEGGDIKSEVANLSAAMKEQPLASGFDEILLPGERGDREYAARMRDGAQVLPKVWKELTALAEKLGVPVPTTAA
jgi:ureidoglycolate dehydrogenase (NAD+)